jgi:hypothetical protein
MTITMSFTRMPMPMPQMPSPACLDPNVTRGAAPNIGVVMFGSFARRWPFPNIPIGLTPRTQSKLVLPYGLGACTPDGTCLRRILSEHAPLRLAHLQHVHACHVEDLAHELTQSFQEASLGIVRPWSASMLGGSLSVMPKHFSSPMAHIVQDVVGLTLLEHGLHAALFVSDPYNLGFMAPEDVGMSSTHIVCRRLLECDSVRLRRTAAYLRSCHEDSWDRDELRFMHDVMLHDACEGV